MADDRIPKVVVDAYVARYPHLRSLAARMPGSLQATRTFAQNACRLAVPAGVSAQRVWEMAKHCAA